MDVTPPTSQAAATHAVSTANAQNPATKRIPKLDNGELIKTSFWISQIFMIIATIVGVYLAAQEGLSQAIKFDNLSNMQNNYHLRHALYDELSDNVKVLNSYAELIRTEAPYDIKSVHPAMATFVWENMRYSPNTLETPSQILSDARRFYLTSADIIEKIERKFYGPRFASTQLEALTAELTTSTLPALKANYESLAVQLQANEISLD